MFIVEDNDKEEQQISQRKKVSKLHEEARRADSAHMKIPEERIYKNGKRILSMDELSMVFTNRLMESAFSSGLFTIHSELGEA